MSAGSYSDFHVIAVFSQRELAESVVAGGYGDYIQEFDLDPQIESGPAGMRLFGVWIGRVTPDGMEAYDANTYDEEEGTLTETARRAIAGAFAVEEPTYGSRRRVICWARNKQHAIKIASELRAQLVANNLWP